MIWVNGAIVAADALTIGVFDRTFEHGLGLFETLRTWGGRPTLLDQHRARMLRSAEELKLPIDPATLPDAGAVARLLEAEGIEGDRMLRITASGGTASGRSVVWMRSSPLPIPTNQAGAIVGVNAWSLPTASPLPEKEGGRSGHSDRPPDDFTARHKTLNYWFKRVVFEQARDLGHDETLIRVEPWGYTEASRANLFLVIGDELITLATDGPIVPGIMRRLVLDLAPLRAREVRRVEADQLRSADEIFLTNAVRGIVPVARVDALEGPIERGCPGPWTSRLQDLIARRLWPSRGDESP